MTLHVEAITAPSFTFTPTQQGDELHVTFTGTGDLVAVEPLGTFLREVRDDAVRLQISRLVLDLRKLFFINSSCLKAFVNLVFFLKDTPHQPMIEFLTDEKLAWQERAVSPLQRMSPQTVRITNA